MKLLQKYNPYHDSRGRFTTAGGAGGGKSGTPVLNGTKATINVKVSTNIEDYPKLKTLYDYGYNLGTKSKLYTSVEDYINYDNLPAEVEKLIIYDDDPIIQSSLNVIMAAGFRDGSFKGQTPKYDSIDFVYAGRIGKVPTSGISRNFAEARNETGVSTLGLYENGKLITQGSTLYRAFNPGTVRAVFGIKIYGNIGSDGEHLLLYAKDLGVADEVIVKKLKNAQSNKISNLLKFNPHHDARVRFASASSGAGAVTGSVDKKTLEYMTSYMLDVSKETKERTQAVIQGYFNDGTFGREESNGGLNFDSDNLQGSHYAQAESKVDTNNLETEGKASIYSVITLNNNVFDYRGGEQYGVKIYKRDVKEGFHPEGTEEKFLEATLHHEIGHYLHTRLSVKVIEKHYNKAVNELGDNTGPEEMFNARVKTYTNSNKEMMKIETKIMSIIHKETGIQIYTYGKDTGGKATRAKDISDARPKQGVTNESVKPLTNKLSTYSAKSIAEAISEAWSEYKTSATPRPLSVKISKYLEQELRTRGIMKLRKYLLKRRLEKYNPYHDRLGRFTSPGASTSFSLGGTPAQRERAIAREKERMMGSGIKLSKHTKDLVAAGIPQVAAETIQEVNKKIVGLPVEHLYAVDANGKILVEKTDNDSGQVKIDDDMTSKLKGAYLTHNHPAAHKAQFRHVGLSRDDIVAAVTTGAASITAIDRIYKVGYTAKIGKNTIQLINDQLDLNKTTRFSEDQKRRITEEWFPETKPNYMTNRINTVLRSVLDTDLGGNSKHTNKVNTRIAQMGTKENDPLEIARVRKFIFQESAKDIAEVLKQFDIEYIVS